MPNTGVLATPVGPAVLSAGGGDVFVGSLLVPPGLFCLDGILTSFGAVWTYDFTCEQTPPHPGAPLLLVLNAVGRGPGAPGAPGRTCLSLFVGMCGLRLFGLMRAL